MFVNPMSNPYVKMGSRDRTPRCSRPANLVYTVIHNKETASNNVEGEDPHACPLASTCVPWGIHKD